MNNPLLELQKDEVVEVEAIQNVMKDEVRILCVEDLPTDVVMLNHALREAGMNFRSKRVDTKEAFFRELEHHPPDVILSDHGLPSFDGFTALAVARDKCPDVPFIFVTSALGEKMTIEAFESGATDYVLKSNLIELAPVVRRALREARERKALKQKEQELRESEERFRMLVEGVKDYAIFMLDPKGHITSWSSGAQWTHGFNAEEVKGRHFSMFYTDQDIKRHLPETSLKTAVGQGRFEEEGWRVGRNGSRFQAYVVITALRDEHRQLRGFAHVTCDITARRETEEKLRQSEALKTAILETALDAIVSVSDSGNIQEWNPAAQKMFGYKRAEAVGQPMDELIVPPALWEVYRDGLTNYLMTGAGSLIGRPIELNLRRKDGSEFRAELAISRTLTEDPPRCTVLVRDITERKKAELALRQSEERLRLLVENVKDYAIYMLDTNGNIVTWNAGAQAIEGFKTDEILGKHFSIFFASEDVAIGAPKEFLKRAEREGSVINEGWRVRKDGSRFWSQGIITALRDDDGKLCGFSKVAHDITQQKLAEEEILRLNASLEDRVRERTRQLEAAVDELEAFSYSVSHDLRAPLLHIGGYAEMLQKEAAPRLDEKNRDHLKTIADGAQQMGGLIDALLEFSRMGRWEMLQRAVNITDLVEEARRTLHREINGRDIEWKIGELPEARGDPVMLKQVIVNLLSNALKYSRKRPRAVIEIGASTNDSEYIYFVRDNGVGFDMRYAGKLFGVFQRLHPHREFAGTGVGLANVRRIIHRHGGRTWAESSAGEGATFYFALPRPNSENPKVGGKDEKP